MSHDLAHAIAHTRAGSERLPRGAVDTALELLLATAILDHLDDAEANRASDLHLLTAPARSHIRQAIAHLERLPRSRELDLTRRHLDDALVHLDPDSETVDSPEPYLATAIAHVIGAQDHPTLRPDQRVELEQIRALLDNVHAPSTDTVPNLHIAVLPLERHLHAAWSFTGFAIPKLDHHPDLVEARIRLFRLRLRLLRDDRTRADERDG